VHGSERNEARDLERGKQNRGLCIDNARGAVHNDTSQQALALKPRHAVTAEAPRPPRADDAGFGARRSR
jgi:hypothetical protein